MKVNTINENLKTSNDWQKICKALILDPDGWDRKNFDYSWNKELITREEFENRMISSTIHLRNGDFENIWMDESK